MCLIYPKRYLKAKNTFLGCSHNSFIQTLNWTLVLNSEWDFSEKPKQNAQNALDTSSGNLSQFHFTFVQPWLRHLVNIDSYGAAFWPGIQPDSILICLCSLFLLDLHGLPASPQSPLSVQQPCPPACFKTQPSDQLSQPWPACQPWAAGSSSVQLSFHQHPCHSHPSWV